jgi:hypothetical protein
MNYQLISTDVSLTLMVLQPSGDVAPSSVMTYQYFVLASETFAANLLENVKNLMLQIYNEHYHAFKLKEPDDPNYIAVVDVQPKVLSYAEYADKPWLTVRPPVWETSHCLFISDNSFRTVEPNRFTELLGLA